MKFLKRNVLCCILSLLLVFSCSATASAASVADTNNSTESAITMSETRSTQVSSASGILQPGESKTYTFSVSWWCTVNFYAGGSIVDSSNGGGRISFLSAIYDFNDYTGCVASVSISPGKYSYTVYNPEAQPITFGIVVNY